MNEKRPLRRQRLISLPLWLVLAGFLLLLGGTGYWLFKTVQGMAATAPIVDQPDFDEADGFNSDVTQREVNPLPFDSDVELTELQAAGESPAAVIPEGGWSGTERVTILLMGIDRRVGQACGETGPVRTDSLMLVTVDPVSKTAGMLSLPRDLWVEIPGFNTDRINRAHFLGEGYELPGGGPALAVDTVENFLGINIHYYVAINFNAFVEAVDLIGGLTLDVPQTIDDPHYPDSCYGFEPFYFGGRYPYVRRRDGA